MPAARADDARLTFVSLSMCMSRSQVMAEWWESSAFEARYYRPYRQQVDHALHALAAPTERRPAIAKHHLNTQFDAEQPKRRLGRPGRRLLGRLRHRKQRAAVL